MIGQSVETAVGITVLLTFIGGIARYVSTKLRKSRDREIQDRFDSLIRRREIEQAEGTPVEKILSRQIKELKQELREVRDLHRQEIADLREERDRELEDVRRHLTSEIDHLRGELAAYQKRP